MNAHSQSDFQPQMDMFRINGLLMDVLDPRGLTYNALAARDLVMALPHTQSLTLEHFRLPEVNFHPEGELAITRDNSQRRNAQDVWRIRHSSCTDNMDCMGFLHVAGLDDDGKTPLRHYLAYTSDTCGEGTITLGPLVTRSPSDWMPWLPEPFWLVKSTRHPDRPERSRPFGYGHVVLPLSGSSSPRPAAS